jgi:hypothetical protein
MLMSHDFPIRDHQGFLNCGILLSTRCLSITCWLTFTVFWRCLIFSFLGRLLGALSLLVVATLPLFTTEGAWVVFIGTSTLLGAFIARFQELVTPCNQWMHLANYLQYFTNLLFSELEVQFLLYVDQRIWWTCHPNLFPSILNDTCNLPLMSRNSPH